jgi:gamma-glutamylcyclotransferase (GGCT)/AIG2-like uncharacterized protein YtfP
VSDTVLYFAYGSNMLRERLAERCPSATFESVASLPDHELTFAKRSVDGSGKCAIQRAKGREVLGVIWQLTASELTELDRFEGAGRGYERTEIQVRRPSGEVVGAITYNATALDPLLRPYDWYRSLVLAGARQHGLSPDYVDALARVPADIDLSPKRPARIAALAALRRAGLERKV